MDDLLAKTKVEETLVVAMTVSNELDVGNEV